MSPLHTRPRARPSSAWDSPRALGSPSQPSRAGARTRNRRGAAHTRDREHPTSPRGSCDVGPAWRSGRRHDPPGKSSPSRWRFCPLNPLTFRLRVRPSGGASTYSRSVLGAWRNLWAPTDEVKSIVEQIAAVCAVRDALRRGRGCQICVRSGRPPSPPHDVCDGPQPRNRRTRKRNDHARPTPDRICKPEVTGSIPVRSMA
jgi:hypothetical protein